MALFQPGQSGNFSGRPRGIRDKRHLFSEELMWSYMTNDGKKVMDVIVKHALEGNMKAASLFCQYVFFKPEASIVINDQRELQDKIADSVSESQIKTIAEILIKKNKTEE